MDVLRIIVCLVLVCVVVSAVPLPMPSRWIPPSVSLAAGGRQGVHGWLWLPTDDGKAPDPQRLRGYWSHHTPEFYTHSPHDFQLLMHAELRLQTALPELPFAQTDELVGNEYTFTPPYHFSLNDLIEGRTLHLAGNFYNGSFDTTYERIKMSNAAFEGTAQNITTVHYLNLTASDPIELLTYLSYPREEAPVANATSRAVYMAHLIHVEPDFDHIVQARVLGVECASLAAEVGATWQMRTVNSVEERLQVGPIEAIHLPSNKTCSLVVQEDIHCVLGPDFGPRCDSLYPY